MIMNASSVLAPPWFNGEPGRRDSFTSPTTPILIRKGTRRNAKEGLYKAFLRVISRGFADSLPML
jgi:hypothetical protein